MTGTDVARFTHKQSRSYLNHLVPAMSKLFEKVLYVRMYQYLINNNLLVDEQFGFRPRSSTMAANFSLMNEIIDAFNSKI